MLSLGKMLVVFIHITNILFLTGICGEIPPPNLWQIFAPDCCNQRAASSEFQVIPSGVGMVERVTFFWAGEENKGCDSSNKMSFSWGRGGWSVEGDQT